MTRDYEAASSRQTQNTEAGAGQASDPGSGVSRGRQALVGVAFSAPALATSVGLILAPSVSGLVVFLCLAGVVVAAVRADGAQQRSRALLDSQGLSLEHAQARRRVVLWLLLAVALFAGSGIAASLLG